MKKALEMLCRKRVVSLYDALVQYFVEEHHQIPKSGFVTKCPRECSKWEYPAYNPGTKPMTIYLSHLEVRFFELPLHVSIHINTLMG
jgi:hypothetical protein